MQFAVKVGDDICRYICPENAKPGIAIIIRKLPKPTNVVWKRLENLVCVCVCVCVFVNY
jgi:hypothetical protein